MKINMMRYLLITSAMILTSVSSIPMFIEEPKDQMVPVGKTIQLTCLINFLPKYVVWYKNDQTYVTRDDFGDKEVNQYSISLLLTPEAEDNNSHYKCQVFYGSGNEEFITSKSATVTVISKSEKMSAASSLSTDVYSFEKSPSFLEQPLDQMAISGGKIEIKCVVNFRPKFVTWFRNNKTYMTQDNFGEGKVYMYTVSLLVKVDKQDNNNQYKCQVWYGDNDTDSITSRSVLVMVKDEGYNLSEFDVTKPVSSIKQAVELNYDSKENKSLPVVPPAVNVSKVSQFDPTTEKPQFIQHPLNVTIKKEDNLEIKCIVNFRPTKVIWFENNHKILIRNEFGTGKVMRYTVSLFLTPDVTDNGNIYRCQVWYGEGNNQSILSEAGKLTVLATDPSTHLSAKRLSDEADNKLKSPNESSSQLDKRKNSTISESVEKDFVPSFLSQPQDSLLHPGENVDVKCIVNFRPKRVIWYLNNKKFTELNAFGAGPTTRFTIILPIKGQEKEGKSEFRSQVWYGYVAEEYIMSQTAIVTFLGAHEQDSSASPIVPATAAMAPHIIDLVKRTPEFLKAPPSFVTPIAGGVEIQCVINFRPVKVIWQENNAPILTRENFGIENVSMFSVTLRLTPDDADNDKVYKCQVFYGANNEDFIISNGTKLVMEVTNKTVTEKLAYMQSITTPLPNKLEGNEKQFPKFVQEQSDQTITKGQKGELNWAVNFVPTKVEWLKDNKVYTTMDSFEDIDYEYVLSYALILDLPSASRRQGGTFICKVWYGPGTADFILSKPVRINVA